MVWRVGQMLVPALMADYDRAYSFRLKLRLLVE